MRRISIRKIISPSAKAKKGAALMDQKNPGWANEMKLKQLDVGDEMNCPIAQIYGNYKTGTRKMRIGILEQCACGFKAVTSPDEYPMLTAAWKCEIRARLKKPAPQRITKPVRFAPKTASPTLS